jgi:hypothetical protein
METDPAKRAWMRKSPDEWIKRNGKFLSIYDNLSQGMRTVFLPGVADATLVDELIASISRIVADEFAEILALCTFDYGIAAQRLMRGMFERLVASAYFEKCPEEAVAFVEYGELQRLRLVNNYKTNNGDDLLTPEERKELEDRVKLLRPKFEEECGSCGQKRMGPSYTKMTMPAMALRVGLKELYVPCYLEPTLQVHNTSFAISSRIEYGENSATYREGPQPAIADRTLPLAHKLILHALDHHNDHFKMGHKELVRKLDLEWKDCWDPPESPPAKEQKPLTPK